MHVIHQKGLKRDRIGRRWNCTIMPACIICKARNAQFVIPKIVNPGRKVLKYSKEEICEAILLRALSPKAYEMIRENSILPLPCKSTLTSKIKHFRCAPGIQKEFFGFIKLKLSTAELWERQCILMFDEMQVSQSYEYCPIYQITYFTNGS